ncbi:MAG: hypothetical protein AAFS10_11050, partial [Myxococcota bacterium]
MTIHLKPTLLLLMFVSPCALTIGCSNLADVSSIDYVEGGNADTGMDDTSGEIDAEVDTSMSDTGTSDTGTSDTG